MDGEIGPRPYIYELSPNGFIARWRGSALAWPLLDALISPQDGSVLCGLHRGDSFVMPDKNNKSLRVQAYRWNGFGFSGEDDSVICESCKHLFQEMYPQLHVQYVCLWLAVIMNDTEKVQEYSG